MNVEPGRDLGRGPVRVPRAQPHDSRGPVIDSTLTVVLRGARTRMPPLFAMLLLLQLWYSVESGSSGGGPDLLLRVGAAACDVVALRALLSWGLHWSRHRDTRRRQTVMASHERA